MKIIFLISVAVYTLVCVVFENLGIKMKVALGISRVLYKGLVKTYRVYRSGFGNFRAKKVLTPFFP